MRRPNWSIGAASLTADRSIGRNDPRLNVRSSPTVTNMSGLSFADVLDDSILVYLENQAAFQDWITEQTGGGSDELSVDLVKQQITYIPKLHKREEVVARVHLLGSVATEPRSALWAWANPAYADRPIAEMCKRVRDFGETREIPELTTGELPIPPEEGDSDLLSTFATKMAAVSCRITGIPTSQIINRGTSRAVMLVDAAGFTTPPASGIRFPRLFSTAISVAHYVSDQRRAAQGYAQAHTLPYGWEPNFSALNIGFPEGNVRLAFSEQGLLTDIKAGFSAPPPES